LIVIFRHVGKWGIGPLGPFYDKAIELRRLSWIRVYNMYERDEKVLV
jgi:hypothetical protein